MKILDMPKPLTAGPRPTIWIRILGAFLLVILLWIGLSLFYPFVIRTYFIQAFKIQSGAMFPTLLANEYILVNKTISPEDVKRGDIIVFKYIHNTNKIFVKRVVALPSEKVEIISKKVYINEKLIETPQAVNTDSTVLPPPSHSTGSPRDNFGPIVVPPKSYFVLGDNRDHSYDSRFWGFVDFDKVMGRVNYIYMSWDADAKKIRWQRIGRIR